MTREQLNDMARRHYRKLKKYFFQCRENAETEAIHQFRVEYKKLRALTRMIKTAARQPEKIKLSAEVKSCYKLLGIIRDLQLQRKRILKIKEQQGPKPIAYLNALQKNIEKLKIRLNKKFRVGIFSKDKSKMIQGLPIDFPWSSFVVYVQGKWKDMHILSLHGFTDDKHIHSLRKHLKDLYYNMGLYKGTEYDFLLAELRKGRDDTYFNGLLDELGHFQDLCTAIALLKPRFIHRLDNKSRLLKSVKMQLESEKEALKISLSTKLKTNFLN